MHKGADFEDVEVSSAQPLVEKHGTRFAASFSHGSLTVAHLKNIRFYKSHGLIVTEEGWILRDTMLHDHIDRMIARIESGELDLNAPCTHIISEPTAIIGGQQNFYHWMFNWLSKFTALNGSRFSSIAKGLVFNGPIERFQWETLFKLGVGKGKNCHFIQRSSPVLIEDAIVPTLFSNPVHSLGHIEWLRSLMSSEERVEGVTERVYISRKDAVKGNRQIINETELIALLEKYEFSIVRLGDLTLKQQASVFRHARFVIAPHGAGLANVIYAQPGACFLEMQAKDAYTQVFWSLGLISGAARYDVLTCESFGDSIPYQKDIEIDLARLEQVIIEKWGLGS
ncbi:glycosyltransferase family 61 protein [Pseudomonas cremoricolorata]|uniref:EGF domain-specific O-linked N-acetylglucosamine transferase n=1 Tax=Pseudomonas cremoricolorata TaxID=157783 RepID=A0A089YJ25_9PSED|nr:glycosyltransferase family 61 protein [Pseudomonas cremoricolorata]AIR91643.1 hypothetical protein LK03_21350 [Pseudomonas cremoricolorata]